MRIRILHIVSSLSLTNGIMNVIMNYYRHIDSKIFQFDFMYFEDTDKSYEGEIYRLGGKVYQVNPPSIRNIFSYHKYLKNYFLESEFDYKIVHFHENVLLSLITPALKAINNAKIIAHGHSVVYSYHPIKSIRNRILVLPMKLMADQYFACSRQAGEFWYGKNNMKSSKVTIIKNAIDVDKFSYNSKFRNEIRDSLGIDREFVLGHVGRFSREKNQEFLIDIFNELINIKPNSILMLVGDGSKISMIKAKVKSLNLEGKVIFMGRRSDVNKLYQAMDIFVFPSLSEGLGSVAIEAQASGLKCIISDSVTKEVDIYNTSFLSLEDSPRKWALEILKNKTSRFDIFDKICAKGYCINNEVKNLESYYEGLLDESG